MANKAEAERVSIWSIGDAERTLFVGMAFAFFVFGLAFVLWYIIKDGNVDQAIFDGIKIVGPVGLSAITLTFFLIEGWHLMIIPVEKYREKYRKERFEEGRKEGKEEGIVQGVKERAIEDILEVLEIRFACAPSHPIADRLAAVDDVQRLKQLLRTAVQISDLEEFQQALDT